MEQIGHKNVQERFLPVCVENIPRKNKNTRGLVHVQRKYRGIEHLLSTYSNTGFSKEIQQPRNISREKFHSLHLKNLFFVVHTDS